MIDERLSELDDLCVVTLYDAADFLAPNFWV
jgi:hypothetical protein